jgi:hypothetical protein
VGRKSGRSLAKNQNRATGARFWPTKRGGVLDFDWVDGGGEEYTAFEGLGRVERPVHGRGRLGGQKHQKFKPLNCWLDLERRGIRCPYCGHLDGREL